MDSLAGQEADIGSNDSEFWFWIKRNDAKFVFFCDYDKEGESPLTTSMQPDWIIEAMGFRSIPEEEIEKMVVKKGNNPGEAMVSIRQFTPRGIEVIREMVVSETTKQVREYKLWSADHKQLLADATILEYGFFNVPPADSDSLPSSVHLPKHMKLNWAQAGISLDFQMNRNVTVNAKLDASRRAMMFVEPEGLARVDLARQAGIDPRASRVTDFDSDATTTRDTLPSPPPRVKLSAPTSLDDSGTVRAGVDTAELAVRDPLDRLGAIDDVVVPSIPTINEPRPVQLESGNGWRGRLGPGIER